MEFYDSGNLVDWNSYSLINSIVYYITYKFDRETDKNDKSVTN